MTTEVSRGGSAYAAAAPALLDSLFYAVSHDLRSPLLTVSLSTQLLEHALADVAVDGTSDALGGLRAACDDLERMLAALNALSRAARRNAEPIEVTLDVLCARAPAATLALDEPTVADLRAAVPEGAVASIEGGSALNPLAGRRPAGRVAVDGSSGLAAEPCRRPIEALACPRDCARPTPGDAGDGRFAGDRSAAAARSGAGMNRGAPIVVIDDDDAHRDLIAHLVQATAPESDVLSLEADEVDTLVERAPFGALILLDRRLGTRDALEIIGPLREIRPDVAVVVMSAFVTSEDRVLCHAAGAASSFQKPGDLNGWRSVLLSLFDDGADIARAA